MPFCKLRLHACLSCCAANLIPSAGNADVLCDLSSDEGRVSARWMMPTLHKWTPPTPSLAWMLLPGLHPPTGLSTCRKQVLTAQFASKAGQLTAIQIVLPQIPLGEFWKLLHRQKIWRALSCCCVCKSREKGHHERRCLCHNRCFGFVLCYDERFGSGIAFCVLVSNIGTSPSSCLPALCHVSLRRPPTINCRGKRSFAYPLAKLYHAGVEGALTSLRCVSRVVRAPAPASRVCLHLLKYLDCSATWWLRLLP